MLSKCMQYMGTYSVASSLLIKIGIKLGNYFSPILINRLLASQLTTTVGALHPLPPVQATCVHGCWKHSKTINELFALLMRFQILLYSFVKQTEKFYVPK